MSTGGAKLLVLVGETFACVRIIGRANFTSSIDFRTVLNELFQRGYRYFVFELSECLLMDSTFLGVLAGFGVKMQQARNGETAIELLNPNARVNELLENLGVMHLFKVTRGELDLRCAIQEPSPAPPNPSREEIKRACLEAHQTLMEINPANVAKFKDVTLFLAEDLKRLKGETK